MAAANVERERQEIAEHPEEEKEELSLFYQLKGIDEATADAMAEQLAAIPTRCSRRWPPRSSVVWVTPATRCRPRSPAAYRPASARSCR